MMAEGRERTSNGADSNGAVLKAYGLTILSSLPCPELLPATGTPQVRVRYGDVPRDWQGVENNGVRFLATPGQLLLDVERVGRFQVRNGNEIIIDRHPGACDDDVRLFLLGSAFGALMHQRGLLVLHGSTVKAGDGCVIFLGRCGAGKSTVATVLHRRGYACLGDDVSAISLEEDGVPYAAPAYPQAKLWVDTLEHFGIDAAGLRRIRPTREKRALPFRPACDEDRIPVQRLYVLSPAAERRDLFLGAVRGVPKCRVLRDYTYRFEYLQGLNLAAEHFKQISHLASRLPIIRINRPGEAYSIEKLADAVEADLRAALEPPQPREARPAIRSPKEERICV
jgi:hypothetical protein